LLADQALLVEAVAESLLDAVRIESQSIEQVVAAEPVAVVGELRIVSMR